VRSTVLRDGALRTVPASELVRGDILAIAEGDAVGADGRLLTATALRISEAEMTGESEPVTKNTATLGRWFRSATARAWSIGAPRSHRGWIAR
jgi:P-type Ca2+ transporter type 2C